MTYALGAVLAVLLICTINTLVQADEIPDGGNWVYFAAGPKGVQHYYDTASILKSENNAVRVWIRSVYSGRMRAVKEIDRWTKRYEINCLKKIYRNFDSTLIMTDGTIKTNNTPSRWKKIPPQTMYEYLHEVLCQQ